MESRPPRSSWLTPYLAVRDAKRSIEFYKRAFGFKCNAKPDSFGEISHAELSYKSTVILMLASEMAWQRNSKATSAKSPSTLNIEAPQAFYVYVDNVDKFFQKAVENGANVVVEPEDASWGDRMCSLVDPDGYLWTFGKPAKKKSSSKKKVTKSKSGKKKITKKKAVKSKSAKKSPKKAAKKLVKKKKATKKKSKK